MGGLLASHRGVGRKCIPLLHLLRPDRARSVRYPTSFIGCPWPTNLTGLGWFCTARGTNVASVLVPWYSQPLRSTAQFQGTDPK